MLALSVRQPWAWAIVAGHKNIENRSWSTTHRGPLLIHAGQTMSNEDLERIEEYADALGFKAPRPDALLRGGIIGAVDVVDVVKAHASPWFKGPEGWILQNARRLPFRPLQGQQ